MKRLLCLSDIHPGSTYGLLPPDFHTSFGNRVRQNAGQAYLWDCWLNKIEWAKPEKLDGVVVLGDVVEGKQPKSRCSELCLPLVIDQEEAAKQILEPLLAKVNCKIYFVKGTFYHDDEQGRSVDNIGAYLRGEQYEGLGGGIYAKEVLDLDVDGVAFDFSHGISVSGGLYRAVAIDREALWSAIAGKTGKAPKADVIVRAHAHYFCHVEHVSKHAVILPAWQLQTSYMRKQSRYRMIPDIGSVLFEISPPNGDDRVTVKKRIYDLPEQRRVKL